MTTTTDNSLTQDEILTKLYSDMTRLAGEIAIDRCRTRVLMKIVKDKLGVEDADLDALFRTEIETNLEGFVHDITTPMLAEEAPAEMGGCCGGKNAQP